MSSLRARCCQFLLHLYTYYSTRRRFTSLHLPWASTIASMYDYSRRSCQFLACYMHVYGSMKKSSCPWTMIRPCILPDPFPSSARRRYFLWPLGIAVSFDDEANGFRFCFCACCAQYSCKTSSSWKLVAGSQVVSS
jgi:hypothetical protein